MGSGRRKAAKAGRKLPPQEQKRCGIYEVGFMRWDLANNDDATVILEHLGLSAFARDTLGLHGDIGQG